MQARLAVKVGPDNFRANAALKSVRRVRLGVMKSWPRVRLGQQTKVKVGPEGFVGQP